MPLALPYSSGYYYAYYAEEALVKVTESVRANPPRTLAALIGLTLPPLTILVTRWLDGWLGDDPQLHAAVLALALPVVTYVVSLAGKWAQQFTIPWQPKQPTADQLVPEWTRLGVAVRDAEPPDAEAGH